MVAFYIDDMTSRDRLGKKCRQLCLKILTEDDAGIEFAFPNCLWLNSNYGEFSRRLVWKPYRQAFAHGRQFDAGNIGQRRAGQALIVYRGVNIGRR